MTPELPARPISEAEVEALRRDGVICARGLFPAHWVESLSAAVRALARDPSVLRGGAPAAPDAFLGDSFVWKTIDACRDFSYRSPAAHVAQRLLSTPRVCLFFDQLFVKPAGCPHATPWHQDASFWPVSGTQLLTIWMALDPITHENSALEFVRGSHRWPARYRAVRPDRLAYLLDPDLAPPPDIDARRDDFDIVRWDMAPGDVLVFDALVLHGSPANPSPQPRHAFATRWAGDDVRYAPGPATMRLNWRHGLQPGDPLGGTLFPQILPQVLPHELGVRAHGPEPRDPELLAETRRLYADAEQRQRQEPA